MGRTGIDPGEPAAELYALIDRLPNLAPDGLHAYDGQIKESDRDARRHAVHPGQERTLALRERLLKRGLPVPRLVMGGTPTFPIHAELDIPGVECSPGTCVLQDDSYRSRYPDLLFTPAALILTRVVSHPRPGLLCLDLGYKAVAADPVALERGCWRSTTPNYSVTVRSIWSSRPTEPRVSRLELHYSLCRLTSARASPSTVALALSWTVRSPAIGK